MTRIKLCGLSRRCDIEAANRLKPEYIGFVFASKSKRYIAPEKAAEFKQLLVPGIQVVGVFVREEPKQVAKLLKSGTIDLAQLHGGEDETYIRELRTFTDRPIIQAFRIATEADIIRAQCSTADYVLLDSGSGGMGQSFDWKLIRNFHRPYFLAGGLDPYNVRTAVAMLQPFAVDVSSGIETDCYKDPEKMSAFIAAVRKEEDDI